MKTTTLAAALALTLCTPAFAANNALGIDSTLNLLTFGNFTATSSDVEGRVAVGGNASFSSYSINAVTSKAPGAALTVAGNLNFPGGSVSGNTVVGGNYTSNYSGSISGNVAIGGTLDASAGMSAQSVTTWGKVTGYQDYYPKRTTGSGSFDLGFDFAATQKHLTQLSSQIDLAANTGSVFNDSGTLVFNATNSNGINVFDVSAADVAKNLKLTGLGSNGTVIINVHGDSVDFGNHGYTFFDSARGQILFNLVDATKVNVNSVEGSILAPKASFSAGWGAIWGQVIAQSWSGNVQVNNAAFKGSLPVAAVPEPESYAMLLAGLGLMTLIARRRRSRD